MDPASQLIDQHINAFEAQIERHYNEDDPMSTEIAIQQDLSLSQIGQTFAQSGFFSDSRDAAQAVVKVMAGAEIGIPPVASMTGIHLIKGNVTIGANLMAAMVKRSGKYNYRIREHSDQTCAIEFFEQGESLGLTEFTAEDAKKAGTQNLQKYAKNMLFARAMSNGVKWHCPDLFGGPVYTPDELATVDENNRPIQAEATVETVPEPPTQEVQERQDTPTEDKYRAYLDYCGERKKDLGDDQYYAVLGAIGLEKCNEVSAGDPDKMTLVVQTLRQAVKDQKAEAEQAAKDFAAAEPPQVEEAVQQTIDTFDGEVVEGGQTNAVANGL